VSERTTEPPAHDRHPPTPEGATPPKAGPLPDVPPISEAEQRPSGALAVTAFLVVAILVSWFGMYALNVVRN
jgi:hypothetical protein